MSAKKQPKIPGLPEGVSLEEIESVTAESLTPADERLIARFVEIETDSLDRLSDGGKRLVEWGTAALGLFFASLALLENPQVQAAFQQSLPRLLGLIAIGGYMAAMLCGFFVSIPSRLRYRSHLLNDMQAQLNRRFEDKYRLLVAGSLCFVVGSLALGMLIALVLLAV